MNSELPTEAYLKKLKEEHDQGLAQRVGKLADQHLEPVPQQAETLIQKNKSHLTKKKKKKKYLTTQKTQEQRTRTSLPQL